MAYDPDKRRVPAHIHLSRLISKQTQERQEWIISQRDYLVAINNLVESIAIATNVEFEIKPDWDGSTITILYFQQFGDAPGPVLEALQILDIFCNQQLRYKLDADGSCSTMANLPANLGNNAFYIEVFDPSLQISSLINARTAKEAQP